VSPLLETTQQRAMAAASAQMDAQLLQLTDLVVLLGGLGGLAFVASSGITKECRTKGTKSALRTIADVVHLGVWLYDT
jgi:hypothetical protein